jgi:heme/copper-type cytochrome/quinol oxidase subunit 1
VAVTVTERAPEASTETEAPAAAPAATGGLYGVIGSGDHKVIGRLYLGFSLTFMLVALVVGALVGIERTATDTTEILNGDTLFQVFTLYRVTVLFLFLWPLLVGLALVVVPLQVGSATVAFPRAAAASFWGWLVGSGLVLASFAANGGPGGGRTDMVDLFVLGFGLLIVSLLLATVCLVTTVTSLRADGMTMARVPLFAWSIFVAGVIWLLSFPVLLANLAIFYVDHRYGGRLEFGTNLALYPQLAWAFSPPQIFVFAVPALGIIGDIFPVFARTRPRSHAVAIGAVAFAGILSFGAAVQPYFAPGANDDALYVLAGLATPLPYLALAGLWALTLRAGGKPRLSSPLHFSVFAVLMLLAGATAAAVRVIDTLDLVGTSFDTAVLNYVVYGTALAAFGGIAYWATKLFGRSLGEGAARLSALVILLGTVVLCVPDLIGGLYDQPDVLEPGTTVRDGVEALNMVSVAGLVLLALGVLIFVFVVVKASVGKAPAAEADPWEAHTLEWATASPPAWGNFTSELPAIHSDRPLLDAREGADA